MFYWLITGFVTKLTRWVPRLVEQKLLTFPEHMSSLPVFSGVRVTQSLVLCACFVDRYLSFCTVLFWPLCSSSIYGFWLPLWYLQTLLIRSRRCLTCLIHQRVFIFLSFLCCGVFLCSVCLRYVSYVSNIDIVSELSIPDFPFGFFLTFTKKNYYFKIKVVL